MRFLPMTIIFTCDVARRHYDVIIVELLVPNFGSKQSFVGIIKYEDIENYEHLMSHDVFLTSSR